ncbi:unnamed protein product [Acanthoscelides obtectus]|uniref:Uncharacterized protein n=1 Tax=Acanthoscelides obtectus TaxID=200917 RepID=A0A9P0Q7F3_ACAOB|nr:unnamed protein product [Acanthoscelides obtectus]CAK1629812.1 hypothetical protein AOBTE_LOCUS5972 [Acanthoscelides obtectus]
MQDKKSKKKENKRSIFQLCFPCIGKQTFSCDEVMCDSFGREFTEYEYVIENLAIRRAPKVLLDSALSAKKSKSKYGQTERVPVRNFGTSVERRSLPEVECGPVIEEQLSLMTPPNEKLMKTLNPTWTDFTPYKFTAPIERHLVRPIKRTKENL